MLIERKKSAKNGLCWDLVYEKPLGRTHVRYLYISYLGIENK